MKQTNTRSKQTKTIRTRQPKPVQFSERELQSYLLKLLTAAASQTTKTTAPVIYGKGWIAWRQNTGAKRAGGRLVRFGFEGCPDIFVVTTGGKVLAVEVKRTGGKCSDSQRTFAQSLCAIGGDYLVVSSHEEADVLVKSLSSTRSAAK